MSLPAKFFDCYMETGDAPPVDPGSVPEDPPKASYTQAELDKKVSEKVHESVTALQEQLQQSQQKIDELTQKLAAQTTTPKEEE